MFENDANDSRLEPMAKNRSNNFTLNTQEAQSACKAMAAQATVSRSNRLNSAFPSVAAPSWKLQCSLFFVQDSVLGIIMMVRLVLAKRTSND